MPLIAYPEVADVFREALEDTVTRRLPPSEAMERVQSYSTRWLAEQDD
jgi:hypothetical protein